MTNKFKVGDRVRVIDKEDGKYDKVGVVNSANDGSSYLPVHVIFEGFRDTDFFFERNLTLDAPEVRKAPKGPQAYKGNGKHVWELVIVGGSENYFVPTYRLRVPGGWLYAQDSALTFVPTPAVVGYAI